MGVTAEDVDYVCSLDDQSLDKAARELNEDPSQRLGAVRALREWIQQQQHIKCQTDTLYLLRILRYSKFSQLRARELLDNYLRTITEQPAWFCNIDVLDPSLQTLITSGFCTILGTDEQSGRLFVMYKISNFDLSVAGRSLTHVFHMIIALFHAYFYDEGNQVNGTVFFIDFTGFSLKHQQLASLQDIKNTVKFLQNALPARLKEFHFFNIGLFEKMYKLASPLLKKKLRDRVHFHSNLETVFRHIPQHLVPLEYQPDDYKGPCVGDMQQVTARVLEDVTRPDMRQQILDLTNPAKFHIDLKTRVEAAQMSFRKLDM